MDRVDDALLFFMEKGSQHDIVEQSCKVESSKSESSATSMIGLFTTVTLLGSNNASILTKLTMIIPCKQKDPKESILRQSPASKFKYVETYMKPFSIMIRYYRKRSLGLQELVIIIYLVPICGGDISHKIPNQLTRLTWGAKSSSQNNLRRRRLRALRLQFVDGGRKISQTSMTSWLRQILTLHIFRW
jgi:hypothetical protein